MKPAGTFAAALDGLAGRRELARRPEVVFQEDDPPFRLADEALAGTHVEATYHQDNTTAISNRKRRCAHVRTL